MKKLGYAILIHVKIAEDVTVIVTVHLKIGMKIRSMLDTPMNKRKS